MKKIILFVMALLAYVGNANAQSYKIGDLYDANGLKGVVVDVDATGTHGLIMSLEACGKKWSKGGDLKTETECFDKEDGANNMATLEKYVKATGTSWENFPLFEWARSLGDGWYIPADKELEKIALAINGGTLDYSEKTINKFSKIITKAKGDRLINKGLGHSDDFKKMFSSTETGNGMVNQLYFKEKTGSAIGTAILGKLAKRKGQLEIAQTVKNVGNIGIKEIGSRAVHKF